MKDGINDPTRLTERAAIEIARYAVDAVCGGTSWFFKRPAKIDRIFARRAPSSQFARALADKLAPLFDLDVAAINRCRTIAECALWLPAADPVGAGFAVRLYGAMSVAFDYALRRRFSENLEWLDPWHAWKYFLPTPTSACDEDYVLICAQLSGASAPLLGDEMLGDSPVLVVDTICRIASLLRAQVAELGEAYKSAGVDGLVQAFDQRRSAVDVPPHSPDVARAAVVYLVSGRCCWGKAMRHQANAQ